MSNEEYKADAVSASSDEFRSTKDDSQNRKDDYEPAAQFAPGIRTDHFPAHHVLDNYSVTLPIQDNRTSSHSTYHGLDNYSSNHIHGDEKDLSSGNSGTSAYFVSDMLPKNSVSVSPDKLGSSGHKDSNLTSSRYQGKNMVFYQNNLLLLYYCPFFPSF